jgi:serine/threonine protein kinase
MGACCQGNVTTLKIPEHDQTKNGEVHMEVDTGQMITRNAGKIQKVYEIGRVVGLGSFGEVREIEHKESGDAFVVKMMTKRLMMQSL